MLGKEHMVVMQLKSCCCSCLCTVILSQTSSFFFLDVICKTIAAHCILEVDLFNVSTDFDCKIKSALQSPSV